MIRHTRSLRLVIRGLAVALSCSCAQLASVTGDFYEVTDASGTCTSMRPPNPPGVKDGGGDVEIILAMHTIDFHEKGDFKSIGFDLDKTCTCEGASGTCAAPAKSSAQDQCDGPAGRDNNASGLIAKSSLLGLTSDTFNKDIAQGEWSMLVRVQGYNGLADDDQVTVSWLVPLNLMKAPSWDGTDTWGVNGTSLHTNGAGEPDIDQPKVIDPLAYVTGGRLVASLKGGAPLQVAGNFSMVINNAFLVATLVQGPGGWSVNDGVMGGIWLSKDILQSLRQAMVDNHPLCPDHPLYGSIKDSICASQDIAIGSVLASEPCDGISLGFTFTLAPAHLGIAYTPPQPADLCTSPYDPAVEKCN